LTPTIDEGDKIKYSAKKEPVGLIKEVATSGDITAAIGSQEVQIK
jgi:hypothetical protein